MNKDIISKEAKELHKEMCGGTKFQWVVEEYEPSELNPKVEVFREKVCLKCLDTVSMVKDEVLSD